MQHQISSYGLSILKELSVHYFLCANHKNSLAFMGSLLNCRLTHIPLAIIFVEFTVVDCPDS